MGNLPPNGSRSQAAQKISARCSKPIAGTTAMSPSSHPGPTTSPISSASCAGGDSLIRHGTPTTHEEGSALRVHFSGSDQPANATLVTVSGPPPPKPTPHD